MPYRFLLLNEDEVLLWQDCDFNPIVALEEVEPQQ